METVCKGRGSLLLRVSLEGLADTSGVKLGHSLHMPLNSFSIPTYRETSI